MPKQLIALFIFLGLFAAKSFADCTDTQTDCLEPGGTRYFEGVPVNLPCWKYQIKRQCGASTDDNCKDLRAQKCVQIDAKCRTMLEGMCVVQDETYNCPVQQCSATDGIVCGGSFYCMNGDCSATDPSKNPDFGKAVSGLAAVGAAGKDIAASNGVHAFSGEAMECSEDVTHVKDCCADSGWGKGWLLNCTKDERDLGDAKGKGVVVPAGDEQHYEYCHTKVAGICTSYHKVYCSFGSKLAKLIQEQGRFKQLHKPFGSVSDDGAKADCGGLTPEELQKIDFSKIDFHEVYEDIKANSKYPTDGSTESKVADRIKDFYDKHQKHE